MNEVDDILDPTDDEIRRRIRSLTDPLFIFELMMDRDIMNDVSRKRTVKEGRPVFESVMKAYADDPVEGFPIRNKASNYRQIYPKEWSSDIHYEFIDRPEKGMIEIGFHVEKKRIPKLERAIIDRIPEINRTIRTIHFDFYAVRGDFRLIGLVDQELSPRDIAQIMIDLIETTHGLISSDL